VLAAAILYAWQRRFGAFGLFAGDGARAASCAAAKVG